MLGVLVETKRITRIDKMGHNELLGVGSESVGLTDLLRRTNSCISSG